MGIERRKHDPEPDQRESRDGFGKWLLGAAGLVWLGSAVLRWMESVPAIGAAPRPTSSQPEKGHELRDANAKWIFGIVVGLFVFGLAIHFILAGLLHSLKRTVPPTDAWQPVAGSARPAKAAGTFPRLQVSPALDLQTFRAGEDAELNTYGWINQTSGVVRLPIEQAMDLLLKEKLPVRSGTNQNQGGPSTYQLIQQRPERRQPEIQGEQ